MPLTDIAQQVCEKRYFQKDSSGNIIENWSGLVKRVVNHVCQNEDNEFRQKAFDLLYKTEFLPNSPCLVNGGKKTKAKGLQACQPGWSRVNTNDGLIRIEDIVNKEGMHKIQTFIGETTITNRCYNGIKNVIRIETEKGYRLFVTEDHLVYTIHDYHRLGSKNADRLKKLCMFEKAENLKIGDALILDFSEKSFPNKYVYKNDIKIDEDLARILAFTKCDGHLKYHQADLKKYGQQVLVFEIIVDSEESLRLISNSAHMNGNIINIDNQRGNSHLKRIRVYGEKYSYLFSFGQYDSLNCDIPDEIFISPKKVVAEFCRAVFDCEGSISFSISSRTNKQNGHVALGMISEQFIRDLQKLLNLFGIQSSISGPIHDKRTEYKRYPMFYLYITNTVHLRKFYEHIGFISKRKNRILGDYLATTKDKNYDKFAFAIKDIVNIGEHPVYDISTSNETYLSEGIVVHNCFVSKSPEDCWSDPNGVGMVENIANFGHIARQGGGVGVDLSLIRPEGDPVFGSTHAKACGPVEHMKMLSEVMSSITQSGFRGMAMLACIRVDHPDILKFITCKRRDRALKNFLKEDIFDHYNDLKDNHHEHLDIVLDKFLSNFNISVSVTNDFMNKVKNDEEYDLVFNGKVYRTIKARKVFDSIVENAWNNGDPGLLFYDSINNATYQWSNQTITATNPCGEIPIPEYGSCNLGSIDVSKFYNDNRKAIEWTRLKHSIEVCIQFLDDVIDVNTFPTPKFSKWAKNNRPVGLGIMGWADLLLKMKIIYGSEDSLKLAHKLARFFQKAAHEKSVMLGKERGTPKACKYKELEYRRNVVTLSIAPTGTISLLANCSSSIEPIFSPVTFRYDNTGTKEIRHPYAFKPWFRCSSDLNWKEHIEMQAAFQEYIDNSISKTINFPNKATKEDVKNAYMAAWSLNCKGVTVYRDGCKTTQVLNTTKKDIVGVNYAKPRPKKVIADIFKTRADGMDWHIIVGKVNNVPYEIFAVNGKQDLPSKGIVIKRKRRHYSLIDDDGDEIIENIGNEEHNIDPRIALETRRFSLELRHNINPKYIVEQIDKSNDVITSFSKVVGRIMKTKYISKDSIINAIDVPCFECAKNGRLIQMTSEAGCWRCPVCFSSRCG